LILDPAVSRRKFAREVEIALSLKHWHQQGIWVMRAEYPVVFVIVVTPSGTPVFPGVLAAVHIDFTDYDVRPPSVRFVDPFTEKMLGHPELRWHFPKSKVVMRHPTTNEPVSVEPVPFVQSFDPARPFICKAGIREYHECSAHSGDAWLLHRRRKTNLLVELLTMFQRYGAGACKGINYQIQPIPISAAIE